MDTNHPPAAGHHHASGDHDHARDQGDHSHKPVVTADNERRIRFVFLLTAGYAVIQAAGGWLSGSLALVADSGHMVSDAAALLLALSAYRKVARYGLNPASSLHQNIA